MQCDIDVGHKSIALDIVNVQRQKSQEFQSWQQYQLFGNRDKPTTSDYVHSHVRELRSLLRTFVEWEARSSGEASGARRPNVRQPGALGVVCQALSDKLAKSVGPSPPSQGVLLRGQG